MKRILLSLGSLLVALALGELAVRVFAPQDLSGQWRMYSGRGYLLNAANARVRHQSGSRVVWYRFNDQHLRGGPVNPSALRVLVLGDSFTFGWLVNEEDTITAGLQRFADREFGAGAFQFLNGGTGGWGTADCLAFLEEFGPRIAPAVVLAVINTDDIGRSMKHGLYRLRDDGLELVAERGTQHESRLKRLLDRSPFYPYLLEHSHLLQLSRRTFLKKAYPMPTPQHVEGRGSEMPIPSSAATPEQLAQAPALGRALFRRMNRWCRDNGAQLLVTTTGWGAWHPSWEERDPTYAFMQQAQTIFGEERIPMKDISAEVVAAQSNIDSLVIPGDFHPNETADALIARLMWSWLGPQLHQLFPDCADASRVESSTATP